MLPTDVVVDVLAADADVEAWELDCEHPNRPIVAAKAPNAPAEARKPRLVKCV